LDIYTCARAAASGKAAGTGGIPGAADGQIRRPASYLY
jgi:hypothetical protein